MNRALRAAGSHERFGSDAGNVGQQRRRGSPDGSARASSFAVAGRCPPSCSSRGSGRGGPAIPASGCSAGSAAGTACGTGCERASCTPFVGRSPTGSGTPGSPTPGRANARGLVGRLALLGRAVARVLDLQGRGDDQHLVSGSPSSAAARIIRPMRGIDRQAGQPSPGRVSQRRVPRRSGRRRPARRAGRCRRGSRGRRRIEERERLDVAQAEGRHLQDHRGQVGALDLGRGELGPARRSRPRCRAGCRRPAHPAAAARPLIGRRLRDRLDRQPLHLGPAAVARDPGRARVDHVADAGHGQRRLGHVGGHTIRRAACGRKTRCCSAGRQPGVEREDLGRRAGVAEIVRAPRPRRGCRARPAEHQDVASRSIRPARRPRRRWRRPVPLVRSSPVDRAGGSGPRPGRCGPRPR